ncbi:MAG: cytochrome c [Vicinamibacteria bacterium]
MRMKFLAIALALLAPGALTLAGELSTGELKAIGEGRALYLRHCAGCHGTAVAGATVSTNGAPDLTQIASRDGRFNKLHVLSHIRFGDQPAWAARAQGDMPCWGDVLRGRYDTTNAQGELKIWKLTRYLEFAQAPPTAIAGR